MPVGQSKLVFAVYTREAAVGYTTFSNQPKEDNTHGSIIFDHCSMSQVILLASITPLGAY